MHARVACFVGIQARKCGACGALEWSSRPPPVCFGRWIEVGDTYNTRVPCLVARVCVRARVCVSRTLSVMCKTELPSCKWLAMWRMLHPTCARLVPFTAHTAPAVPTRCERGCPCIALALKWMQTRQRFVEVAAALVFARARICMHNHRIRLPLTRHSLATCDLQPWPI